MGQVTKNMPIALNYGWAMGIYGLAHDMGWISQLITYGVQSKNLLEEKIQGGNGNHENEWKGTTLRGPANFVKGSALGTLIS